MKKQNKLLIKIQRLLKQQLNSREYSHFGPKKYKLSEHFFALIFMQIAKLSFRRVSFLLVELGFYVPSYSALCKSRKRIFPSLFGKIHDFKNFFADTAYDSENVHEKCFEKNIQTFIKPRKNVRKGFYRRKQMKNYSEEKYHRRSLAETGFSILKRKYGGYTLTKSAKSAKAEMYLRTIASNLNLINN